MRLKILLITAMACIFQTILASQTMALEQKQSKLLEPTVLAGAEGDDLVTQEGKAPEPRFIANFFSCSCDLNENSSKTLNNIWTVYNIGDPGSSVNWWIQK